MDNYINAILGDTPLIAKIQSKIPYLFQLAEIDNSRNGKLGMEIGSARERIILALFIYKFGEENVDTNIPITQPEVDVKVLEQQISIKTITGATINGIKLIWTVDAEKATHFISNYKPICDMVLVQINWGSIGYIYFIPKNAQEVIFSELGNTGYLKLPKPGTNPRGVELSRNAVDKLLNHNSTRKIKISWNRQDMEYKSYDRWIEYWNED